MEFKKLIKRSQNKEEIQCTKTSFNKYAFHNDYYTINISDFSRPIIIESSPTDSLIVECFESSKNSYKIKESDVLTITSTVKSLKQVDDIRHNEYLLVAIPKNTTPNININQKYANIIINNIFLRNLDITSNTSCININNCNAKNINIEAQNGSALIKDTVATANINVNVVDNSIQLKKIDFGISSNIVAKNCNVSVALMDLKDDYTFNIKSTGGTVKFNNDKFKKVTSTSLKHKKKFTVKVVNGDANVTCNLI